MATYTMELYRAIEVSPEGNIGLDNYPIWDEEYREVLNQKIIDHYHSREIGMETVDMFRFAMRRRMNEVMPYYNDLYGTTKLGFDPLSTVDIRTMTTASRESETESEATSVNESRTSGKSRAVESRTPQVNLSGNGDYATGATDTNGENTGEGSGTENANARVTDDTDSESHTTGYQGAASDLIQRYRDTLLNIDLMVISELSDLFMMVWDTLDSYSPYPFTRFDAI